MHLPHSLPALSKQASLVSISGCSPSSSLTYETSQPTGAPDGGNQQVIDAKPPQVQQVGQMFMGPARHQLVFVKVVGGRCQTGFISVLQQKITQGLAQSSDEIIRLNIGDSPVRGRAMAPFLLALTSAFIKGR